MPACKSSPCLWSNCSAKALVSMLSKILWATRSASASDSALKSICCTTLFTNLLSLPPLFANVGWPDAVSCGVRGSLELVATFPTTCPSLSSWISYYTFLLLLMRDFYLQWHISLRLHVHSQQLELLSHRPAQEDVNIRIILQMKHFSPSIFHHDHK